MPSTWISLTPGQFRAQAGRTPACLQTMCRHSLSEAAVSPRIQRRSTSSWMTKRRLILHKLQLAVSQRWLAAEANWNGIGHWGKKSEGNVLLNGARQIAPATPRKKHLLKCIAVSLVLENAGNKVIRFCNGENSSNSRLDLLLQIETQESNSQLGNLRISLEHANFILLPPHQDAHREAGIPLYSKYTCLKWS